MDKTDKWEVRRGNQVLAHGPAETMPTPEERKMLLSDGYKIYVDGKLLRTGTRRPASRDEPEL